MAFRTQRYGIQTELRGARGVITNLNAIAKALDATRLAATKTFHIDRQVRRLGEQTGATAAEFRRLQMATAGLTQATGVSIDKTTELVTAYQATGRSINVMRDSTGKATDAFVGMSGASAENMRMMTQLVGRFNVSAQAAVKMEHTIGHLAGKNGFGRLLDATTRFQDKFNVPGLISELPKVVDHSVRALSQFGREVTGNSEELIQSALKTGAAFSKAFGVQAPEAISKAMASQQRFMQQTRNDLNVFLGLASDFDPMTKALQEVGMSMYEVNQLTRLGRDNPVAFARQVRNIYQQLGGEGSLFAERFLQNIRSAAPEAVKELVAVESALREAEEAQREAAREAAATRSFTQMAEAVQNIGAELLETINNLAMLGKTIIGLTFVEDFSEPMQGAVDIIKRFNNWVRETALNIRQSDWFKWLKPRLQEIGKVLLTVGAGARVIAETFAGMLVPVATATSLFRKIPVVGEGVSKIFGSIKEGLLSFAKGLVKPLGILAGVGVALDDFGRALKDPTITQRPGELVVRGFRAMAVGIVEVFDNLLFGLPTQIAKWFYPKMQGTLGDVTRRLFTDLQIWLQRGATEVGGSWWENFKQKAQTGLQDFYDWLNGQLNIWHVHAAEWGQNIGRAIGTLAHWAWEAISPLFQRETWSSGWERIVDYFTGQGRSEMVTGIGSALSGVLGVVGTFTRNMVDEMLRPWGKGWLDVKEKFHELWDALRTGFSWVSNVGIPLLEEKWLSFKVALVDTFYAVKDAAVFAFDIAAGAIKVVIGEVGAALYAVRGAMKDTTVWRAEAALTRAMANPLSTQAERDARTADVLRVRAERRAIQEREDFYRQMSTEGDTAVTTANTTYDANRIASQQAAFNLTGADQFRLAQLRNQEAGLRVDAQGRVLGVVVSERNPSAAPLAGSRQALEQVYTSDARRIQDAASGRRAALAPAIARRERDRAADTAQRTALFSELQTVKQPYIDRTGQILTQLEDAYQDAQTDTQRDVVQGVIDQVNAASRDIVNAQSGVEAVRRWNQLIQDLDRASPRLRQALGQLGVQGLEAEGFTSPTTGETVVPPPGTAPGRVSPTSETQQRQEGEDTTRTTDGGQQQAARDVVHRHVVTATLDANEMYRWQIDTWKLGYDDEVVV